MKRLQDIHKNFETISQKTDQKMKELGSKWDIDLKKFHSDNDLKDLQEKIVGKIKALMNDQLKEVQSLLGEGGKKKITKLKRGAAKKSKKKANPEESPEEANSEEEERD